MRADSVRRQIYQRFEADVRIACLLALLPLVIPFVLDDIAHAQPCIDYGDYIHWVSLFNTDARPQDVAVEGAVAYVAIVEGLELVDVSDPSAPQSLSIVSTPLTPSKLAVSWPYVYSVTELQVLYVFDVANSHSPVLVGTLALPADVIDIAVSPGWAFITTEDSSVLIVDVKVPGSPAIVSQLPLPSFCSGITVRGDVAYVAAGVAGCLLIDVSNPFSPQLIGGLYPGLGAARDVVLSPVGDAKTYAYVAYRGEFDGLMVMDVSDPFKPLGVGITFLGGPSQLSIEGRNVFVSDAAHGFKVIDVSDPAVPTVVGSVDFLGILNVVASGQYVYAVTDPGLYAVKIGNGRGVGVISGVDAQYSFTRVRLNTHYAYVTDLTLNQDGGMRIIDLESTDAPSIVSSVVTGQAGALAVGGSFAYLRGSDGLLVADISVPEKPAVVSSLSTVGGTDMTLDGTTLFVVGTNGPAGYLTAIDVSNPHQPIVQSRLTAERLVSVVIRGSIAYCAAQINGLSVFDVSNPTDMHRLGGFHPEWPYQAKSVAVDGSHAYVVEERVFLSRGVGRLEIVDISDPHNPTFVSRVELPSQVNGVMVHEGVAYVAGMESGIYAIDVADPHAPQVIGGADVIGEAADVMVKGNLVYVAAGGGGLQLFPLQCGQVAGVEVAAPINEGGSLRIIPKYGALATGSVTHLTFTTSRRTELSLRIYDIAGRAVRELLSGSFEQGTHSAVWDARNDAGQKVGAGGYFVRLTSEDDAAVARIILIP